MDFTLFSNKISKIKDLALPGESAHLKMAPEHRIKELQKHSLFKAASKKAAVMALFYPNNLQVTHLLLILRKSYKGVHSNEIGLPGGKVEDSDVDLQATALRETFEEVGVPSEKVQVIRAISPVFIPPSNFEVQPFIGLYDTISPFVRQESEVEELVEVSLDHFLDDTTIFQQNVVASKGNTIVAPAFKLNGYIVWGATAMMLIEIKALLEQVL